MRLGEILVHKGLLSTAQLDEALAEKGADRIGEVLIRKKLVAEADVYRALAEQIGIPFMSLENFQIEKETLEAVPVKVVFQRKIMPITQQNGTVTIAVSDPLDFGLVDELRVILKKTVKTVGAAPSEVDRLIKTYYGVGADEVDQMVAASRDEIEIIREGGEENGDTLQMAEDASLIKFVNQLLVEAVRDRASDVHVEPMEKELRIRYRIDGVLHVMPVPPAIKRFQSAIVSRIKIMSSLNIAEKRLPQDGRIQFKVGAKEIDVRVSIIPGIFGEGVVLRILDRANLLLSLMDLGMPQGVLNEFSLLINEPHGIILVTGPTGSGKTTTLYSALDKINKPEDKIITVEDPVEYHIRGIKQIQIHPKIGLTFANGLRSILRHDPDIIMIGEIRDMETAEIAVQSSLTGHLVLSTLHTNDAPTAVTRLVEMGVESYLVASTVEGVMAQRLVRRVCKVCKREGKPAEVVEGLLPKDIKKVWSGEGCKECHGTGYRGRCGLFEMMVLTDAIREMIIRGESSGRIKKAAIENGMKTLRDDGWDRVRDGTTTAEEVLRITKSDR